MPRNPTVYTIPIWGYRELSPGGAVVGPQVPEGYQWVITDIEVAQGGSTSEFISFGFGFYTPTGTSDDYFEVLSLTGDTEILYPSHLQWTGRIALTEGIFLGAASYAATQAPNFFITGYQLTLP